MAVSLLFICKVLLPISESYHIEYLWSSPVNHGACKYCQKKTNSWTTVITKFPGACWVESPSRQSRENITHVTDALASGALELFIRDRSVCPSPLLPSKCTDDAEKVYGDQKSPSCYLRPSCEPVAKKKRMPPNSRSDTLSQHGPPFWRRISHCSVFKVGLFWPVLLGDLGALWPRSRTL